MFAVDSPINRSVLLLLLYWPVNSGAQTAAETDWTVLKPSIFEAENQPLKQCAGQYLYRSQPLTNVPVADQSIRIRADDASLILDQSASITGHVEISSSDRLISADAADINLSDNQLNLLGQVILTLGILIQKSGTLIAPHCMYEYV